MVTQLKPSKITHVKTTGQIGRGGSYSEAKLWNNVEFMKEWKLRILLEINVHTWMNAETCPSKSSQMQIYGFMDLFACTDLSTHVYTLTGSWNQISFINMYLPLYRIQSLSSRPQRSPLRAGCESTVLGNSVHSKIPHNWQQNNIKIVTIHKCLLFNLQLAWVCEETCNLPKKTIWTCILINAWI